jgi:hypothetical protein
VLAEDPVQSELRHFSMKLGMNLPPKWSAVSEESINHSKSNKDIAEDIAGQSGNVDVLG